MAQRKAHDIGDRERTQDIHIEENVDFDSMYLSENVLLGLKASGFERPSPIQLAAIPLGRCGLDMVVQAKSGTGKTCVFTVVALEMVSVTASTLQVLVLTPTREIAVQVTQVINSIGSKMTGLRASTFIGGMDLNLDKAKVRGCHVAIGTPGRIKQLIEMKLLQLNNVRLFIMDEADQLLTGQFTDVVTQIASALPLNKQIITLSATYTEDVAKIAEGLMRSPNHVRLGKDSPALLGVDQYVRVLPFHHQPHKRQKTKYDTIVNILSKVTFNQCLVFSNSQLRAESVCNKLRSAGWPASFLSGGQAQRDRLMALDALCSYKCRVLVSTDLAARGLDSEHANLVINMDVPRDHATYLHRVGRAGRFGSRGCAVTLVTVEDEVTAMRAIATMANVRVCMLQDGSVPEIGVSNAEGMEFLESMNDKELAQMVISCSTKYETDLDPKSNAKGDSRKSKEKAIKISSKDMKDSSDVEMAVISKVKARKKKKEMMKKQMRNEREKAKAEDFETVMNVMKKQNQKRSFNSFSFDEIMSEVTKLYDQISANDNPVIRIPSLPEKLEVCKDELTAFTNHTKAVQEDLEEVIMTIDDSWKNIDIDVEKALQCRIEGKDIFEAQNCRYEHANGDAIFKTREKAGFDTDSNISEIESKSKHFELDGQGVIGEHVENASKTSRSSSKNTLEGAKTKKNSRKNKIMQNACESSSGDSKSPPGSNITPGRKKDYYSGSNCKTNYANADGMHAYDTYSAYYGLQYPTYGNYYNQWNTDCNDHYANEQGYSYANYEAMCRTNFTTYQRYLDSAEKFASMMDYVQTMAKMSYRLARDYCGNFSEEK